MEIKVKPKAVESSMTASKTEDDDQMKTLMKECVMIGQEADEDISQKGQYSMKIVKSTFRQNQDHEIRRDDSKNDSRSSSSASTSPSLGLEIMKKLEIDNNEKTHHKKEEEKKNVSNMKHKKTSSLVWDCGSTLYDSFELNSFKRQLDSAISASARTMSMSHLPDRRLPPLINSSFSPEKPPIPLPPTTSSSSSSSSGKKHSNKISRSLQRFLKSVFRPKQHQSLSTPSSPVYKSVGRSSGDKDRYYVVYDKSGSLTTIPESTEKEVGPEMNSLVRKTVSERFPASRVVGITCA